MNVQLEKDYPSLKNAITMACVFLVITLFVTAAMVFFTLPLKWDWTLVGFALCVIFGGVFLFFFAYCFWYIIAFLCYLKETLIVYREDGYIEVVKGKQRTKITREEIDFISAKKQFAPLRGIEPNIVEIHVKGEAKPLKIHLLERPEAAKGLVNDVIKGKITKVI